MNRRKFLKACLSAGVAMNLENVRAVEFCESVPDMIDAVRCKVGLKSNVVAAFADEQEASQWCWAACIQMIFAYHGHPVKQQRIVAETWGKIVNMPADPYQITEALNREWTDDNGEGFYSSANSYAVDVGVVAVSLKNDMPLIIGTHHHAMLLTAMHYTQDDSNKTFFVHEMRVRDPWPGKGSRSLSKNEVDGLMFAATVMIL
jgi:hypothetical protein